MHYIFAIVMCLILLTPQLNAMPLSPESVRQLRASGQLQAVAAREAEARTRGIEVPGPNILPSLRALRRDDRDETVIRVPVILVEFPDNRANQNTHPREYYERQFFSEGELQTGSARDYYKENSYGDIAVEGQVSDWVCTNENYAYYVDGQSGMGRDYPHNVQGLLYAAAGMVDDQIDFSEFDRDGDGEVETVVMVHAGLGADQDNGNPDMIWSMKWSLYMDDLYLDNVHIYNFFIIYEGGDVGAFCHEAGHAFFGLPDLYDVDYSSDGLGMWSIMAAGSWGGGGARPVHFDAWCKYRMGIINPTILGCNQDQAVIPAIIREPMVYMLWTNGNPGDQYFLVEYRRRTGFDESLPNDGLCIYHVDEEVLWGDRPPNMNEWYPGHEDDGHYGVAIEQADGNWDMEHSNNRGDAGDPYPGSSNNQAFNAGSTPDSRDYDGRDTHVAVRNITLDANNAYCDIEVGRIGGGNAPDITVNHGLITFDMTPVGQHGEATLVIGNAGNRALNVQSITPIGDESDQFEVVDGDQFSLNSGQSRNVTLGYNPTAGGIHSCILRIVSNDPDENPRDLTLTGGSTGAPVITEPSGDAMYSLNFDEGTDINLHFLAYDPDGGAMIWRMTNRGHLPEAATFTDNGDGSANLQWATNSHSAGGYAPILMVTDEDTLTDQIRLLMTINNVNHAPTLAHAPRDTSLDEDCDEDIVMNLYSIFHDPDDDTLIFTPTGAPEEYGLQVLANGDLMIQPAENYSHPEPVQINLAAADGEGESAEATSFRLAINPVNDPPGAFDLLSPADSSWLFDYHTLFSWSQSANPDPDTIRYTLKFRVEAASPRTLTIPADQAASISLTGLDAELLTGLGVVNGGLATWWVEAGDGVATLPSTQQRTVRIPPLSTPGVGQAAEPVEFSIGAGFPNPFNSTIRIDYALPQSAPVRIAVYSLAGACIATLEESLQPAGYHSTVWSGRNDAGREVPAGIYLVRVQAGPLTRVVKAALVR